MERVNVVEDPKIRFVKGFLSPEECDQIVDGARATLTPAVVFQSEFGRVGYSDVVNHRQTSLVMPEHIHRLIAAVTGLPAGAIDQIGVINSYRPGEIFAAHNDALTGNAPGVLEELQRAGQRLVSFLIYLNDDYEGGETAFPNLKMHFKGRKGDALYWSNVDAKGEPHPLAFHAGLAPTCGEKWTLAQMIRTKVRSA
jgi:hypothetical protein